MGRQIKQPQNWKKQFLKAEKIADEPAMNRQGFWRKPDFPHVTDKETRRN